LQNEHVTCTFTSDDVILLNHF